MTRRTSTGSLTLSVLLFCTAAVFAIGTPVFWGVTQNSGESAYGRIEIPGSQLVTLPQGRVDLTFTMDLSNQTVAIPILDMSVQSTDGGPSPTVTARIGAPLDDNGVTHVRVGAVTIDRAGTYRISVDGYVSASPNPQLLIGRVPNHAPFIAAGFAIAGLALLGGIVSIVLRGRRRPLTAAAPALPLVADPPRRDPMVIDGSFTDSPPD